MAHIIAIDTLAYANKLKAAGLEPKLAEAQAEAQAELLSGLMDDTLATKHDIKELRTELRHEIRQVRAELKGDLRHLEANIKQLENKLLIKLGGIMITGVGLLATMLTMSHTH
jgi:transposase